MAIDVGTFKGEAPRIAPRLLPNDMGQYSGNARLLSGNLESWKYFNEATTQAINTNPLSIYFLDDQLWLTWNKVGIISTTATITPTVLPSAQQWTGCAYNGNTTVVVYDQQAGYVPPYPSYNVIFERPSALQVMFAVSIANKSIPTSPGW